MKKLIVNLSIQAFIWLAKQAAKKAMEGFTERPNYDLPNCIGFLKTIKDLASEFINNLESD